MQTQVAIAGRPLSSEEVGWPANFSLPRRLDETAGLGAERFGESIAIVDGERRLSYNDLERNTRAFARLLTEAGVTPGERVAILLTNRFEFFSAYFGICRIGAVAVPLGTRLSESEVAFMLRHSRSGLLLFEKGQAERAQGALAEAPGVELIDVDELPLEEAGNGPDSFRVEVDTRDDAAIFYTSGTSASPKGVRLTHRGVIHAAAVSAETFEVDADDVTLGVLPAYHSAVHFIALPTLIAGGCLVLAEGFRAPTALEQLERHKVTLFPTVTAMAILIAKHVETSSDTYHLEALRRVFVGGAGVPDSLLADWRAFAPGAGIANCFGLTEMGPSVSSLDSTKHELRDGSVGPPYRGIQVRISGPEGETLPCGEIGEILTRGESMMAGYLDNEAATAETLVDGWLHTGDLGRMDEDGYIYIAGREKHMIKRGGENVFPDEVEAVIIRHGQVKEVAVLAVPDEVMGERVAAILAPAAGVAEIDLESVISQCREELADFKVPELVTVVEPELPKNNVGKMDVRGMRDGAAAGEYSFVNFRRGRIHREPGGENAVAST